MARGQVAKRIELPTQGDYLTDGLRLVEVVGKCRKGIEVIDVREVVEDEYEQARAVEVLDTTVVVRKWRRVEPGCDDGA
jgi:hypothetical protein